MGKKRKPAAPRLGPKKESSAVDEEIPEGFEVLDPKDFATRITGGQTKKLKRKGDPFTILNAQPWQKLETNDLQFLSESPQMLTLEELDGTYYDQLFIREDKKPLKKQKISHDQDTFSDQEGSEDSDDDSFKEAPMFLAPSTMKQKQKKEEKFNYILAPQNNQEEDQENDVYDEEEDYELEESDQYNVDISGVVVDDEYSDDDETEMNDDQNSDKDKPIHLEQWSGADPRIVQALSNKLSITAPTTCQQLVLPAALSSRQDILLAAPTVSNNI